VQVAVQLELAHAEAVRPNMRVNLGEAPLDGCMKELGLLAREGRNSPATGSARFQPSHVMWFGRRRLNDSNSI
jgi:hypothetical protein